MTKDFVQVTVTVSPDSPKPLRVAGYDMTVAGAMRGAPDIIVIQPGDSIILMLDDHHDATLRLET